MDARPGKQAAQPIFEGGAKLIIREDRGRGRYSLNKPLPMAACRRVTRKQGILFQVSLLKCKLSEKPLFPFSYSVATLLETHLPIFL